MTDHEFSDEEAYEAIEELQQAAARADTEPLQALFSDTAALVAFLMKERDEARATLRYCEGKWSEERGTMLDKIADLRRSVEEAAQIAEARAPLYSIEGRNACREVASSIRGSLGDANDPGWDGYR